MQACFTGRQLRLRLGNVGRRHLAGSEAVARILERALENANVVLLYLEIGGVARHVHVGGCRREQDRLFHDAQCLARGGNLAFRLAHVVGGLLAVEQRLPAVDTDRTRGGVAFDRVGHAVGQVRRNRRDHAGRIGKLLSDRSVGGKRRAISGQRLRDAFIVLADDGALRVELGVALIGTRQRRLHGLRSEVARRRKRERDGCHRRRRDRA